MKPSVVNNRKSIFKLNFHLGNAKAFFATLHRDDSFDDNIETLITFNYF